jgi:hypothetical protein
MVKSNVEGGFTIRYRIYNERVLTSALNEIAHNHARDAPSISTNCEG